MTGYEAFQIAVAVLACIGAIVVLAIIVGGICELAGWIKGLRVTEIKRVASNELERLIRKDRRFVNWENRLKAIEEKANEAI